MPTLAAVIPAAGSSRRFGRDKLAADLDGRSVLQRALDPFLARSDVARIAIVTADELAARACLAEPIDSRVTFCTGGPSRAHSVRQGVLALGPTADYIAIHDAARPLLTQGLIDRTLAAALEHGAAVGALPVHLTIKEADGPLPAPVRRTIPRQRLWAMQTPQIIRRQTLLEAFACCPIPLEQVTDDVQLVELAGGPVWLVPGEDQNLKITTPADLLLARQLLDQLVQGE
jgi:2-C-methyl-D-erythritol 4-phosphate cytidylyltransferase